jgi:hypothetical protein
MRVARLIALLVPFLAVRSSVADPVPHSPEEMARAATAFLGALTAEQRAKAAFDFADAERLNWHFVPRTRRGLPLKEMTAPQREAARTLLRTGVGQRGLVKVDAIISLEQVLRDMGGNPAQRDPDLYFFSVFGTPSGDAAWGWRLEGHHLSVNFTVVAGQPVATAPAFFGANPARVPSGPREGFRALAAEEDLARELITALRPDQRERAIIAADAPRDIITGNANDIDPLSPAGIAATDMDAQQSALLVRLLDEYLAHMADDIAAERRARLQQTDFSRVTFAWAGATEVGQPHYYRIQGPSFLVEFDNTQNNANHIHSVWRDFNGDFGRDLLREHYAAAPHPH